MQSFDISLARSVLASQPFNALLGATLTEFGPDLVVLRLSLRPDLMQQHGFAHGGVVSYLADNALAFAGGGALNQPVVTSEYKINYVRPAIGEALIARASVVHAGRQQAVCTCKVYCETAGQERLVAVAQGTIALMGNRGAPANKVRHSCAA